ncbi:MAG: hypothetical protein AAF846_09060 [Chloroflexota bacterium]
MMNNFEIDAFQFHQAWVMASVRGLVSAGLVALVIVLPMRFLEFNIISPDVATMLYTLATLIAGAASGAVFALIQRKVLRSKLYWASEQWLTYTVMGSIPGGILVALYLWLGLARMEHIYDDNAYYFAIPLYLLCVSIAQSMTLHKVVYQAWLWVIANVSSGIVCAAIYVNIPQGTVITERYIVGLFSLMALFSLGLSQSLVLYFLFTHHIRHGKRKKHKY